MLGLCSLGSFRKKEISLTTNKLRWPRAIHQKKQPKIRQVKDSCPSPTKMLRDLSKLKPANKNTQRKMDSDVALMKSFLPNGNETRQLQDMPPPEVDAHLSRFLLSVRKKSGDEYEPTALRGIIASVKHYLINLRYSESIIEGQRLTVELFERHLFKRISQF